MDNVYKRIQYAFNVYRSKLYYELMKGIIMENILIYHYDNDGDIVFHGLVTDELDLSIMLCSLRYNYGRNIYFTKLSNLSNEVIECKKDSNIKYLMCVTFNGIDCSEPKIEYKAFHTQLDKYYDRLLWYKNINGCWFVFKKVIDTLSNECISDAIKKIHELFKSLQDSLKYIRVEKNRTICTDSDVDNVVNTIDSLMNNNERERIEREEKEKLINKEKELLKSLLDKYGVPDEYVRKEYTL